MVITTSSGEFILEMNSSNREFQLFNPFNPAVNDSCLIFPGAIYYIVILLVATVFTVQSADDDMKTNAFKRFYGQFNHLSSVTFISVTFINAENLCECRNLLPSL